MSSDWPLQHHTRRDADVQEMPLGGLNAARGVAHMGKWPFEDEAAAVTKGQADYSLGGESRPKHADVKKLRSWMEKGDQLWLCVFSLHPPSDEPKERDGTLREEATSSAVTTTYSCPVTFHDMEPIIDRPC